MKKKILIVLTIAFSLLSQTQKVLAQEVARKQLELEAQISVTQNVISQIIVNLQNAVTERKSNLSSPDYIMKATVFNEKVESALLEYEKVFATILAEANLEIQKIWELKTDPNYSYSQRKALIEERMKTAKQIMIYLSNKRDIALQKLYLLDTPSIAIENIPDECFVSTYNYDYIVWSKVKVFINGQQIWSDKKPAVSLGYLRIASQGELDFHECKARQEVSDSDMLTKIIYFFDSQNRQIDSLDSLLIPLLFEKTIKKECYTSSCVALYSDLRSSFFNMIKKQLDKSINLYTDFEYNLTLEKSSGSYGAYNQFYQAFEFNKNVKLDLPFQISEEDFRRVHSYSKRQEIIDNILGQLVTPTKGFWHSWSCPSEISNLKKELCQGFGGCLTTDEENVLVQKIKNAELGKTSDRLDCLKRN
ncbi:MAG TPA: hypothetical protein PLJ21_04770 [Pseudobdellovibrionaceae bacterium]|nr:hypothetical protein [Pseudobdellovibrionaceae bacterium]